MKKQDGGAEYESVRKEEHGRSAYGEGAGTGVADAVVMREGERIEGKLL